MYSNRFEGSRLDGTVTVRVIALRTVLNGLTLAKIYVSKITWYGLRDHNADPSLVIFQSRRDIAKRRRLP